MALSNLISIANDMMFKRHAVLACPPLAVPRRCRLTKFSGKVRLRKEGGQCGVIRSCRGPITSPTCPHTISLRQSTIAVSKSRTRIQFTISYSSAEAGMEGDRKDPCSTAGSINTRGYGKGLIDIIIRPREYHRL